MGHRTNDEGPGTGALERMTTSAFVELGEGQIAYIKPVTTEDGPMWAIHGANGEPLAVVESRALALAALRQNDLEAFGIH